MFLYLKNKKKRERKTVETTNIKIHNQWYLQMQLENYRDKYLSWKLSMESQNLWSLKNIYLVTLQVITKDKFLKDIQGYNVNYINGYTIDSTYSTSSNLNFCLLFSSNHSVPVNVVAVCTWFVADKQVMCMESILIQVLHYDWWWTSDSFPWISD